MGAASRTTVIPPPCESAASQYRVGLLRFESGRVLVVQGGVFECSSRMNGKPSSPVLRGLGASDGARLLDPWDYFRLARHSGIRDSFGFQFGRIACMNIRLSVYYFIAVD